ncbi:VOC family protein [Alteraurantiacibacter buctensis]|uniref:VOC family protein n=1 Tax=Alteraurantiacibacter buctensis TaxID=1503981 RepID=A0A844YUM7_9SPHN|nr:VOC family protein [Alteraurantiacibacter buctensis]MXO70204.1 VOC family protein [Alteraurantiacibacter buctensis]
MFSHMTLGANDIARSQAFYDALFAAWGGTPGELDDKGRLFYRHRGSMLLVTRPLDGQAATHGNGSTVGFMLDSPEQIDAWHAAGLAHGGTTCEDPPGWRPRAYGRVYLAYLRDPDGNKLCAMKREESAQ